MEEQPVSEPAAEPVLPKYKIIRGVRIKCDENEPEFNATLFFRSTWFTSDKRVLPHRFSGKRVGQDSRRLRNLHKRANRLAKYGWVITLFPS